MLNAGLFQFEEMDEEQDASAIRYLRYPHRWFLACRYGGCSCHFRHWIFDPGDSKPVFGPPEDWSPEDADNLESTSAAYDAFCALVKTGEKLDLVDIWADNYGEVDDTEVCVDTLSREAFRFFENHRFEFVTADSRG